VDFWVFVKQWRCLVMCNNVESFFLSTQTNILHSITQTNPKRQCQLTNIARIIMTLKSRRRKSSATEPDGGGGVNANARLVPRTEGGG